METSDRILSAAIFHGDLLLCHVDSKTSKLEESAAAAASASLHEPKLPVQVGDSSQTATRKQRLRQTPGISVTLFPMLQQLLASQQLRMNQIELISLTSGPGAFTGLRAAVVAAKTMAYALKIPVVTVDSLDVIAHQTLDWLNGFSEDTSIEMRDSLKIAINAQRGQLLTAQYRIVKSDSKNQFAQSHPSQSNKQLQRQGDFQLISRQQWAQQLTSTDVISGGGIAISADYLNNHAALVADERCWYGDAVSVGRLAWQKFLTDQTEDIWSLAPNYFRPSYAEEKSPAIDAC